MKYFFVTLGLLVLLGGCGERKPEKRYDGEKLLAQKCSTCHNLDMPPKTTEDEKAPPMMAVTFHIRDFMKVSNPSEKRERFVEFVTDYALYPEASKSFCDRKSLQEYGVMPSQKGKVTRDELRAIAGYMYDHYDPEKFMALMSEQARLAALPLYKRVLEQKNCLGCHGTTDDKIAPAFAKIAKRYRHDPDAMKQAIRQGSRGKWKGFKLAMPPFRDLGDKELEAIVKWILSQAKR